MHRAATDAVRAWFNLSVAGETGAAAIVESGFVGSHHKAARPGRGAGRRAADQKRGKSQNHHTRLPEHHRSPKNDAASNPVIEPEDDEAGNVASRGPNSPIGSAAWICRSGPTFPPSRGGTDLAFRLEI